MSGTISKSNIQSQYQGLISQGMEDWEARATVINSILSTDNYYEPGTSDYYFIVSEIWRLCI
jgi:hypothetical protein